ncbi:prolyl aminopeptidase [Streptomyces europaeiscabiei]|uniref:Proline iminopeptidase n=1 Tax=Streptomyces europaeiscabiei TaxID=146819 RepID=A0ABU4NIX7_9ACTN|nr:prolyl aminopeptidase [Streptomyces europaeiscabiei]MDX2529850.1 prolyl aminopeptidase [Streptomyces europaeiscabiei]MDX2763755.1 prolyl aminopeptidase [Streptomyces europaeiscabiei]MDX2771310.1 prolyl aminopeptidase [Streptomyces europaeiscabiei]MDX3543651.1 prolyl aminopeptidase [Streptomyces europaeiscabiei]MDX3553512.1 prolyl aminopeptidase [Streptomyces europaeiscabiei]
MPIYPEIEPYDHGMLDVGDGNRLYWEVYGDPRGKPAVVLHGGPGSRANAWFPRLFDPEAYRIVLLDQRGCGRSTPPASAYETDMSVNTTDHLIADLELLRRHLGIGRWLVWGVSWGSALGLRYAQTHPEAVTELVLTGVATGSDAEVALLTRGLGQFFPEAFERFLAELPEDERDGNLAAAYNRLLESPDEAVRARAARAWTDWETAIAALPPRSVPRYEDPAFRYAFARTVTHYWGNGHFLDGGGDGVVLRDAHRLKGIPGTLVQGSLDPGNLLGIVWRLHHAWPGSELLLIDDVGHSAGAPDMAAALVAATDKYAKG